MEFDFQCLIYKYTLAGARSKFEDICTRLLQRIHGDAFHNIRPSQGDGGIDGMVGSFPGPIEVYQCKYFPQGLGDSQKDQIRKSFQTALNNPDFTMSRWVLCIPIDMSKEERKWWDGWLEKQKDTGVEIVLWDGSYLLNLLRDQKLYDEVFGIERTERPELLTKWMVDSAGKACTTEDVYRYYRVDHRFTTMLRVIAADRDVPHTQALQVIRDTLKGGRDVILGGNSGMGKTSLMLRCAVEWVRDGKTALWLNLSERRNLTSDDARSMRFRLLDTLRPDDTALVCIDDPYEGQEVLDNLREYFAEHPSIRLILAERTNRLRQMNQQNCDCFNNWLEDAAVVTLEGLKNNQESQKQRKLKLGDRETIPCTESPDRRARILEQCLMDLVARGNLTAEKSYEIQQEVLYKYDEPYVTLVELIYRGLFQVQKITKHQKVMLDWDEWERFIKNSMGKNVSTARWYGVIAACSVFDVPMTLDLFARIFDLKKRDLQDFLRIWKDAGNLEPVLYWEEEGIIRPKHGVIAELFFLFHNLTPAEVMEEIKEFMNEAELGYLLSKQPGQEAEAEHYLKKAIRINCQDIQSRMVLGRLLSKQCGREKEAERYLMEILEIDPKNIQARTELGRLLAKQPGREVKAEEYLKEAMEIDPKHIQSRTELGRLLSEQPGREDEAEKYLKEAMEIDPKHTQSLTELGRLLSKQCGRENEAERYLMEILEIDPKNIQARTELERLLAKQPGREVKAEEYLKEAMEIDPKHIQSRTEPGRLLSKQAGREGEAEQFYREVLAINPGDSYTTFN